MHATDKSVAAYNVDTLVVQQVMRAAKTRQTRVVAAQCRSVVSVVGRDSELVALRAAFTAPGRRMEPVVRVLSGLGGVGKSSLARAYATASQSAYAVLWWIRAEDPDLARADCLALLQALAPSHVSQISEMDDPVQAVHVVLANMDDPWLLVLDSAHDSTSVLGLVPASGPGDVIITSRAAMWPNMTELLPLTPLPFAEAVLLLTSLSGDPDQDSAGELAIELGGLPLALAQAASYVRTSAITNTLAGYLSLYRRRRGTLHQEGVVPGCDKTVATTWKIAFDQLGPDSRALLNLCCWYAADNIPIAMLLAIDEGLPEQTRQLAESLFADEVAPDRAVRGLQSYSLVDLNASAGTININKVVQCVTIDHLNAEGREWLHCAADLLLAICPQGPATRTTLGRWRTLQAHTLAVVEHLPPDDPRRLRLRGEYAGWLGRSGDVSGARDSFAELLLDRLRTLGSDHLDTLVTRGNVAFWTAEAGDVESALKLFAELVVDQNKVLGADDHHTFTTRNNLAFWTGRSGNVSGARDLLAELLADQVRLLGATHPSTLTTRNNLATCLGEAGDIAGARKLFAELLADRIRELGPDHPSTLCTRSNVASCAGRSGDVDIARDLFAELLVDRIRILGPDHPETLGTRASLAFWTGESGDVIGARELLEKLSVDRTRVLGSAHPDTICTQQSLEFWRRRTQLN